MLSLQRSSTHSGKTTPNLLPCRIEHNGPVNANDRYWQPQEEKDEKQTCYFRGRKLRGHKLQLPDGYRGAVLSNTSKTLPEPNAESEMDGDEEDADQRIEVRVMEEVGEFDEVVVWGHEAAPDATEDPYSKGISELIDFAGAIHATPAQDGMSDKSAS